MKTIRIAVTGLKRSGKTVFITSLVNQLLNRKDDSMPDFPGKKKNWLIYAELLPLPKGLNRFPYEANLQALRQNPPEWPSSTKTLSEIHLKFSYRKLPDSPSQTLKLEIVDYPGEWLPDLQMLQLPFHEWSRIMITRSKEKSRSLYAHKWLDLLEKTDASAPITDYATYLVDAYINYLFACHNSGAGLMDLQPGHFLNMPLSFKLTEQAFDMLRNENMPENILKSLKTFEDREFSDERSFLNAVKKHIGEERVVRYKNLILKHALAWLKKELVNFCPLPLPDSFQKHHHFSRHSDQTLFSEFERRYLKFRCGYISPFYNKCFHRANVQVVLLDVLNILNWGMESYNDHHRCIEGILTRFKYGRIRKCLRPLRPLSKYLPTFLPLEKIEKTIFVATKADHAIPTYHENMAKLVADLVSQAQQVVLGRKANAKIIKTYISSIRSTEPVEDKYGEVRLRGIALEHQDKGFADWRTRPVPEEFPSEKEWNTSDYLSYRFQPIKFPAKEGTPVPHINLDQLLGHILQDYL